MSTTDTIRALIHLPRKFNDLGDVSVYSLLHHSGYFENHHEITEDAIHEMLLGQPECIDEWVRFSDDKRSSSGWFLQRGSKGYQVGYFPDGKAVDYFDDAVACAAFIKREIENIRTEGKKPHSCDPV